MKRVQRIVALCCALCLAAALCGCGSRAEKSSEPLGKSYFGFFDTVSFVYSYAGDSAEQFADRSAEVSHILEEYHQLFDIYHEYSGKNNLCTLNRNAGGEALEIAPELMEFLLYCRQLYELTGGEMNVMLGSVLHLWHDCREEASADPTKARLPEPQVLEEAARHCGIELLELDEERGTARISDPQASIDVGAVGKGYATEMAARALEAEGVEGYVLNIGGNIRILGSRPDGTGWVTGIRDPLQPNDGDFALRLRLQDTACVSSGAYERYYTVDGQRYHHIIDKDTLYPAAYYAAISVVTKDSGLADALSTALYCMPYEESCALAESLEGVEVLWIMPDGEQRWTPGLEELIAPEEANH